MRDDIPEAAFRLSTSLTVHTHVRSDPESSHWRQQQKANHQRAVKVLGKSYESLVVAATAIGCSREKIRRMEKSGEAVYLDGRKFNRRGSARPITIAGRVYDGVEDACVKLRMGKTRLYAMLDSGEAVRE